MASTAPTLETNAASVRAEIGKDRLIDMYKRMMLIREFEQACAKAFQAKKIAGFLHLYSGQEAVATGFFDHMSTARDYCVTSYRCHAQALLCNINPNELMAELYGKITGNVRGKGGSMHFFSKEKKMLGGHGIVGGQTPVGTGAAFTCKYTGSKGISLTFMGDGAVAQGTFHESLNIASLWGLPAIFIVENNKYGMGTACSRAIAVEDIAAAKAPGYDMRAYTFDGLDLYASWKVAQKAITYAREASKPVLIEAKTYRYFGHSLSDPGLYRAKEEVKKYREIDPIGRIAGDLVDEKWASEDDIEGWGEEIRERIAVAVKFADESPIPPMSELMEHVLAP